MAYRQSFVGSQSHPFTDIFSMTTQTGRVMAETVCQNLKVTNSGPSTDCKSWMSFKMVFLKSPCCWVVSHPCHTTVWSRTQRSACVQYFHKSDELSLNNILLWYYLAFETHFGLEKPFYTGPEVGDFCREVSPKLSSVPEFIVGLVGFQIAR